MIQCGNKGIRSMTNYDDSEKMPVLIIRGGWQNKELVVVVVARLLLMQQQQQSSSTSSSSSISSDNNDDVGSSWNANPKHSYKPSIEGMIIGGWTIYSIAQIYNMCI
jgi:alpha-glucuronidase